MERPKIIIPPKTKKYMKLEIMLLNYKAKKRYDRQKQ